jgi:hypothetical protein
MIQAGATGNKIQSDFEDMDLVIAGRTPTNT